ncbi:MAG: FAD-binding oxidoreductase [Pseudomonadota bacterium]
MTIFSDQSPVTFNDALPDEVDVVVIGAGVIGISTAWFLAKNGLRVAVCEKGRVAGEQSSRNWGWIRKHGRDYAELPIMMESIDLWEQIASELNEDIGFTRSGVMYLAKNDEELARRESWLPLAREHNLDTRMLSAKEVGELIPGNPGNWAGASYTPSDGKAEPFVAVPAIARALQNKGVTIKESCTVRELETQAGRVSGVVTEHGLVRCQTAVCAGGAWASMFSDHHGAIFPQLSVRATVARTEPTHEFYGGNAASTDLSFRRRADGGYTLAAVGFFDHFVGRDSFRFAKKFIPCLWKSKKDLIVRTGGIFSRMGAASRWAGDSVSPFENTRVLNPEPLGDAVDQIKREKNKLAPLADAKIAQCWAGMIDATPDIVPVIDEVSTIPGYFIAAGMCGHGFGIGPGIGRVLADTIAGKPAGHDMSRFRFGRFSDGSKTDLGPAL